MANENLARADDAETNTADEAGAQAHGSNAVHSNDTKGDDDFAERVAKANTPEELAQLTNEFLTQGETPAQTKETEGEAPEPEQASGQESGEDAGEKGEDETTDESGEVEEEEHEEEAREEKPGAPVTRTRARPPADDRVGIRALELQTRNPDLTVEECVQRARAELGLDKTKPGKEADAPEAEEPTGDAEPETVEEADARLKDLRAQRRKAMTEDLDFAKAADLDDQIDALKDRRLDLVAKKATAESKAASEYDAQFDAAQSKAAGLYEFVGNADSAEAKRMLEIDAQLKASGDPLYSDPEKPLILAQMVAREYRIAPKASGKTSTKTGTTGKPVHAQPKNVAPIASGSSRTASTANNTAGQQLLDRASRIKTPAEMEEFLANLRP